MKYIILTALILIGLSVFAYFLVMLITSNTSYSVWYDSPCSMVIDELQRTKQIGDRLFINLNLGKIWGLEQIIREKC